MEYVSEYQTLHNKILELHDEWTPYERKQYVGSKIGQIIVPQLAVKVFWLCGPALHGVSVYMESEVTVPEVIRAGEEVEWWVGLEARNPRGGLLYAKDYIVAPDEHLIVQDLPEPNMDQVITTLEVLKSIEDRALALRIAESQ
jgi:hypothetical protein